MNKNTSGIVKSTSAAFSATLPATTFSFTLKSASDATALKILQKGDTQGGRRIIAGPASVNIVDLEGDLITAEALAKALPEFLENNLISYQHMDIRVGSILKEYVDPSGRVFRTEVRPVTEEDIATYSILSKGGAKVGDVAFFLCAEIKHPADPEHYANKIWADVLKGEVRCFSVAGQSLGETKAALKCEGLQCKMVNIVGSMAGSGITLCKSPVNPASGFEIISKALKCDSCGELTAKEFDHWEKQPKGVPKIRCRRCGPPAMKAKACPVHGAPCPVHGMEKSDPIQDRRPEPGKIKTTEPGGIYIQPQASVDPHQFKRFQAENKADPSPAAQAHMRVMDVAGKREQSRKEAQGVNRPMDPLLRADITAEGGPCLNTQCKDAGKTHANCHCYGDAAVTNHTGESYNLKATLTYIRKELNKLRGE